MDQGTGMASLSNAAFDQTELHRRHSHRGCNADQGRSYALKSLNKTGEHERPKGLIKQHDYFTLVLVSWFLALFLGKLYLSGYWILENGVNFAEIDLRKLKTESNHFEQVKH